MKATQKDFASVAPRAAKQCKLFFFCGPDEAGAAAAAQKLINLLPEAGERVELSGGDIKSDPVLLVDEARSTSLFGGTRHLYIRAAGEEAHDAVKTFIAMADAGETSGACPVFIIATSATDKSRTAKLLDKRADALVAMFYPPDLASVAREVRAMADAAGVLGFNGELAERVARAAGLDLRLAQSEITKLALYLDASPQTPRPADAAAMDAIGAKTEEDGFMPLVNVVLSGELNKVPNELRRMHEVALNPVAVTLALERRCAQLAGLSAKLRPGNVGDGDIKALLDRERVFFRDHRELTAQLKQWNGPKLERLVLRLAELHCSLLANSQMAELNLAHALTQIARVAAARR